PGRASHRLLSLVGDEDAVAGLEHRGILAQLFQGDVFGMVPDRLEKKPIFVGDARQALTFGDDVNLSHRYNRVARRVREKQGAAPVDTPIREGLASPRMSPIIEGDVLCDPLPRPDSGPKKHHAVRDSKPRGSYTTLSKPMTAARVEIDDLAYNP